MKSASAELIALLDSDALETRDLMTVQFPTATFGFWSGLQSVTFASFPGVIFVGAGNLIEITDAVQTLADTVQGVTIIVNGLSPDAPFSSLTDANYHARKARVTLARALYDPKSSPAGALVAVDTWFRGYGSQYAYREESGVVRLEFVAETRAAELDRATNRTQTTADQASIASGDLFFDFAPYIGNQQPLWGRTGGPRLSPGSVSAPAPAAFFGGGGLSR